MANGAATLTTKVRIGMHTMTLSGFWYGGLLVSASANVDGVSRSLSAGTQYVTVAGFKLRITLVGLAGGRYTTPGYGSATIHFEDSYNQYTGADWVPLNGEDFFEVGPTTVSGSDEGGMDNTLTVKLPVLQEVV